MALDSKWLPASRPAPERAAAGSGNTGPPLALGRRCARGQWLPLAVQRKEDETVVFSWLTWPSRAARDAGMHKSMDDSRLKNIAMPFDGKRMIYGGFEVISRVRSSRNMNCDC